MRFANKHEPSSGAASSLSISFTFKAAIDALQVPSQALTSLVIQSLSLPLFLFLIFSFLGVSIFVDFCEFCCL